MHRLTHHIIPQVLLTSKQKLRLSKMFLLRNILLKQQDIGNNLMGHPVVFQVIGLSLSFEERSIGGNCSHEIS